jgi:hypothetical protein
MIKSVIELVYLKTSAMIGRVYGLSAFVLENFVYVLAAGFLLPILGLALGIPVGLVAKATGSGAIGDVASGIILGGLLLGAIFFGATWGLLAVARHALKTVSDAARLFTDRISADKKETVHDFIIWSRSTCAWFVAFLVGIAAVNGHWAIWNNLLGFATLMLLGIGFAFFAGLLKWDSGKYVALGLIGAQLAFAAAAWVSPRVDLFFKTTGDYLLGNREIMAVQQAGYDDRVADERELIGRIEREEADIRVRALDNGGRLISTQDARRLVELQDLKSAVLAGRYWEKQAEAMLEPSPSPSASAVSVGRPAAVTSGVSGHPVVARDAAPRPSPRPAPVRPVSEESPRAELLARLRGWQDRHRQR